MRVRLGWKRKSSDAAERVNQRSPLPHEPGFVLAVRELRAIPWPAGLGKDQYPGLDRAVAAMLGQDKWTPSAHKRAITDDTYRRVVRKYLERGGFDHSMVEHARHSVAIARQCPLVGVAQASGGEHWWAWVRETVPRTDPAYRWLMDPPDVTGGLLANGRHRVTYLRLLCDPTFEVVTCAER